MIIEIAKLSQDGDRFVGEEPASILGLEDEPHLRAKGSVRYDLFAQVVSHELVVKGSLEISLACECSRCAVFFSTTVGDSSFLRAYDLSEDTEFVDLTKDIREGILLNLPHFPVCRQDCKGLCPQCGKNLNEGTCTCTPPTLRNPWEALDQLDL